MRLHVVRHGRTAANAAGRLLGRGDPPLDGTGRAQAAAAAAAIASATAAAGRTIDRVVTSPLARTRETAAVVADAVGAPVERDERWIELDYGSLEGAPLGDVPPELWARWRADLDFVPAGGESLRALGERVAAACDELAASGASGDVVVVTHVSPVKAALVWALGVDHAVTWRTFVAPGSITTIDVRPAGPVLLSFDVTPGTLVP